MPKIFPVLIIALFTLTACSKEEPVVIDPTPIVPVETEAERPTFNTNIDSDDAFNQALGSVPSDETPQFVEVIDDLDADEIQGAEEGEKLALESEADKEARAASEARGVARRQNVESTTATGLEFRPYSEDLYAQVKGVRPAIVYFTSDSCEACATWEAGLRANAAEFSEKNALILMVDFDDEPELADELGVSEAGVAMMLTGVGEVLGPRPTDRLDGDYLNIFFR